MKVLTIGSLAAALSLASPAYSQEAVPAAPEPTPLATAADIKADIADMEHAVKAGQSFVWKPVVRTGGTVAALEYWTTPRPPAIHPHLAEYVMVVAGSGTLVSGGTMTDQKVVNPGQIDGGSIIGGVTRRIQPGDVFLVPGGVPHWFGIDGGKLVLLGTKIPESPSNLHSDRAK